MAVSNKLMFVSGKPFQPSLMFTSKAGAYPSTPSGAPLRSWYPQTLDLCQGQTF